MEKSFTSSKPLQTRVKQCMEARGGDEPELVKYMSKLPIFLERAETPQENLLSVGVLDWGRLEKWQHSHNNRIPVKTRFPSVSQADASLVLPRDESSAGPSKVVHDRTSACRMNHRSSRHPKFVEETVKEYREIKGTRKKKLKDHRCYSSLEKLGPTTDAQGSDGYEKMDRKGKTGGNMEVKSKGDGNRRKKSEKKLRERNRNDDDGELGRKQQGEIKLCHSAKKLAREEAKTCKRSSSKYIRIVHDVKVDYCTQHACPLPCKADGCLAKNIIGSTDADPNKVSVETSQGVTLSTKARNTSSRGKITEDRASSLLSVKHCMDAPAQRPNSKPSISPFQRLSFSMGKTSKTNSEGVAGSTTQLDSMANSTKTGSQNLALSSGFDGLDCNKPREKDTTTTSHLRRLLEPLLKPRATHSGNSVEGPRGQGVQRIKLGITGCKTVNVNDSAHEKKLGSSMIRAALRVTVKNNQPLFTFAVNKETDILAASQKKMGSSDEGECTCVYTFFSIKDHKRNSAWLNQRGRGQTHGIISNVVAQMRVSSSLPSGSIREFVLFSVELDQESTEKSDLQLKNELAAIIVKMPRWYNRRASLKTVQDHNALNKELEDHIKDRVFDQDISATVILQSGVHSMPHKGGPSSLIQRWRTGGSCDCGGWDMGCNLRILTNQHNFSCKNSTTSNSPPSSNRFELFFLGEQAEEHPFLSFKPIKEGIYSVVYDSSLSQLQAFSICMALAESRKISEIAMEHKSSCDEHKARTETVLVQDQDLKPSDNTVGYQRPISPVGWV
ncbi:hypothetical protein EUTSA_v10012736mg [Eutrema salsugineum]|uniref:Uncharacterized protein n=1 Tax=Eutrema salsugineum TaxID=72664 RepID=V4KWT2_EUTSA|nr:uncharacterized protein LOC18017988 [Eutrema salsugineum]XP_024012717.1 uncharacterized protein LOC18017988 [Eutrema salsugineum]XP_024012718.1 uncharacterized protein LOC18017988 [Eutrema salsugineum]ESQ42465.1 hypothetical protein EUTSA_v10012736mg [Eutrema salsugineum]